MDTLLLNPGTWDLMIDADGNIAMAAEPYANAQDVASAVRLFQGELYYDTEKGMPYFTNVLGVNTPIQSIQALFEKSAKTVPDIVQAKCTIQQDGNRKLLGSLQVINTAGQASNVQFN